MADNNDLLSIARELGIGDTGDDVKARQRFLASSGVPGTDPGIVDGFFGPKTSRADQKFRSFTAQEALKEEGDGTVTKEALQGLSDPINKLAKGPNPLSGQENPPPISSELGLQFGGSLSGNRPGNPSPGFIPPSFNADAITNLDLPIKPARNLVESEEGSRDGPRFNPSPTNTAAGGGADIPNPNSFANTELRGGPQEALELEEKGKSFLSRAGSGFADILRKIGGENALGNPDIQQALGQIGEAIDAADPSKKPGFATALSQAANPIISANIRKSVLETLESGGDLSKVPGIGQLKPEEIAKLQAVSGNKEAIKQKKELTTVQIGQITAKTNQLNEVGTFKERATLQKDIALIKAAAAGIKNPKIVDLTVDADGNDVNRKHKWILDANGQPSIYVGPAEAPEASKPRTPAQIFDDNFNAFNVISRTVALNQNAEVIKNPDGSTSFRFPNPEAAAAEFRAQIALFKESGILSKDFPETAIAQSDIEGFPVGQVFLAGTDIERPNGSILQANGIYQKTEDGIGRLR